MGDSHVTICRAHCVENIESCPCGFGFNIGPLHPDLEKQNIRPCTHLQSISWLDGIKGDLNRALDSLGLVLLMFVVLINCCLGFLCCHLVAVIFLLLMG